MARMAPKVPKNVHLEVVQLSVQLSHGSDVRYCPVLSSTVQYSLLSHDSDVQMYIYGDLGLQ